MMLMMLLIAGDGYAAVSKLAAREWKLLLDRQTAVAGSNGLLLASSYCHSFRRPGSNSLGNGQIATRNGVRVETTAGFILRVGRVLGIHR